MTQYQKELQEVKDRNGDVEAFKKEWHERAAKVYRTLKTPEEISDFRRGKYYID